MQYGIFIGQAEMHAIFKIYFIAYILTPLYKYKYQCIQRNEGNTFVQNGHEMYRIWQIKLIRCIH